MSPRKQQLLCGVVALIGSLYLVKDRFLGSMPLTKATYTALAPDAKWPWTGAKTKTLASGVTQTSKITSDGTYLDLFTFDFAANPRLRWEIFDQDEDDAKPFDNRVLYWHRNVAKATKDIEARGRGPVLVAWNGAFFCYDYKTPAEDAFHASPVILRGQVHFNTVQYRWTFGVKNTPSGPVWKTLFKPDKATMQREFDYGAGSVQCLIKDGKPLKVEPFPLVGGTFKKQPVASDATQAGHIPYFDHMRTCRASIGWSKDNKKLYFLAVKELDDESASSMALSWAVRGGVAPAGATLAGGWTVPDVQRFWISKGVWGAINSDAGGVMQWVARQPQGGWIMTPPRQESNKMQVKVAANWNGAVTGGGSIMYFMVRELPRGTN